MKDEEFEKVKVLKKSDLLKELESAKYQIKDYPGNAWIYKVLTDAGIQILLLENEIHELENLIDIQKLQIEEYEEREELKNDR